MEEREEGTMEKGGKGRKGGRVCLRKKGGKKWGWREGCLRD